MAKKGASPNRFHRPLGSNPPSGRSNADEHFHEVVGSNGFWIYLTPNAHITGMDRLRAQVERLGCTLGMATDAPVDLGQSYPQLKISPMVTPVIPEEVLKLAHRWAHRHDFLHSFFKPTFPGLG